MHTKLTERFLNYKLSFFSKTLRIENNILSHIAKKIQGEFVVANHCN